MSPLIEPELVTRAEAAELLGVTERTIDRLGGAEDGRLTKIIKTRPFGADATLPTTYYDRAQVVALLHGSVHDE